MDPHRWDHDGHCRAASVPTAIFLRAANVGGNNVFSPKAFAEGHPALALTNIGHAGTFVSSLPQAGLMDAVRAALPVDVPMAIIDQEAVAALVAQPPATPNGAKAEVTVFLAPGDAPTEARWPARDDWEILVERVTPWCAVTLRRPGGRLSPYQLLQKATGRPGTTRSWGIMEKVAKA